jgi:hypothetical protein
MPQRLFITLGSHRRKERILLEMPGDQPVRGLIPDLIQVLGWKELDGVPQSDFYLETEEGERLPDDKTLKDSGVVSSDVLFIAQQEADSAPGAANPLQPEGGRSAATPVQSDASAQAAAVLKQPHLLGPRGLVFVLDPTPVSLGRAGKGNTPDIDLSEWDPKMIISRRHAVIEKSKERLYLRPGHTTNGTFINGVEIPAGETRLLHDGDRIHFGFKGLELIFQSRSENSESEEGIRRKNG